MTSADLVPPISVHLASVMQSPTGVLKSPLLKSQYLEIVLTPSVTQFPLAPSRAQSTSSQFR
jgi:hypothetical protein